MATIQDALDAVNAAAARVNAKNAEYDASVADLQAQVAALQAQLGSVPPPADFQPIVDAAAAIDPAPPAE